MSWRNSKSISGLDLQGGIHLVYKVDTSGVDSAKVPDALNGLQDVIERRVNAFGVAEPLIETSKSGSEQTTDRGTGRCSRH